MELDLGHASILVNADELPISTRPLIISHTGLCRTCDNSRNLTDAQVRAVAATGGVIGIALFEDAVDGTPVQDTVSAMIYGADLVGADHIALESNFDGAVVTPIDIGHIDQVAESPLRHGFSETETGQIIGGNVLWVLRHSLP